jgi:hypothetical protein
VPYIRKCLGMMMKSLKKWLQAHNTNRYKKGIDALVSCWHRAVECDEDYVEK